MSNDSGQSDSFPIAPAATLLFQAPEFPAPAPSKEERQPSGDSDASAAPSKGEGTSRRSGKGAASRDERSPAEEKTSNQKSGKKAKKSQSGKGEKPQSVKGEKKGEKAQPGKGEKKGDGQASRADAKSAGENEASKQPSGSRGGESGKSEGEAGAAESTSSSRRRRRRTRSEAADQSEATDSDQVQSIKGSTRLEAKRMRRREGRKEGRRRHSITEAEFLARRESVDRQMIVRHEEDSDQVAVLEDGILVEHFVTRRTNQSVVGNIYLGKVQNVLPSMEAAFIDIGRGRNAVLYAGEVNWDALGMPGKPRRIETALSSGDNVLVQVTKDPIGHKGARLTSQITLAGRYLVLVPGSTVLGISRKLPDNERNRLKKILKQVVPEGSGVIVRTAAEGATVEQLTDDVQRLTGQWDKIQKKVQTARKAPVLLRGEPQMVVRVVRDLFNEDVSRLIVQGDETWDTVHEYVEELSPELLDRMEKWTGKEDVFDAKNVRSQLAKGMDRKVWLPSGGTLIIERTEALTVIDVNTGKFVGSGGTLEETVTRNNLEAAEEIVRQLRLRDIGGIIIIDFVDMVLEANRELVLRRLVESLGRDRTRHQVTEITSLGLVQMTRKRVGEGLVEAFSTTCEECEGRGFIVHDHPVGSGGGGSKPRARKSSGRDDDKRKTSGRARRETRSEDREPQPSESGVGDAAVKSALSAIAAATVNGSKAGEPAPTSNRDEVATAETAGGREGDAATPSQGVKGAEGTASPRRAGTNRAETKAGGRQPRGRRVARAAQGTPKTSPAPVTAEPQGSRAPVSGDPATGDPVPGEAGAAEKTSTDSPASTARRARSATSVADIVLPSAAEPTSRPRRRRVSTSGPVDTSRASEVQASVDPEKANSAREAVRDLLEG